MERRFTPAAMAALVKGDLENYVAAITPGGIEAQEKNGQLEQAQLETLPISGTSSPGDRAAFEKLGFVFGQPCSDRIFITVKFPDGWSKKPTNHDMWTDIVDQDGKTRGSIFYKAAFYDKRAFARLERD